MGLDEERVFQYDKNSAEERSGSADTQFKKEQIYYQRQQRTGKIRQKTEDKVLIIRKFVSYFSEGKAGLKTE